MIHENWSSSELRAVSKLALQVGFETFVAEFASAVLMSALPGRRVAVVGVVKRGKSTLINKILQQEVTPVGILPETAAVLAFSCSGTRPRKASGIDRDLRARNLPSTFWRFRRKVRRASGRRVIAGKFEFANPLPLSVWLVDTPGFSESSIGAGLSGISGMPNALANTCDGIIAVLGVPGFSATDMHLLQSLSRLRTKPPIFVVLKALDSSIDMKDLEDYSSQFLSDFQNDIYLQTDGDLSALRPLIDRVKGLNEVSVESAKRKSDRELQLLLNELEARLVTCLQTQRIKVPRLARRRLPTRFSTVLSENSPRALKKQLRNEAKIKSQQLKAEHRNQYAEWKTRERFLKTELRYCRRVLRENKTILKTSSSMTPVFGCALFVVGLPLNLLLLVGAVVFLGSGLFWIWVLPQIVLLWLIFWSASRSAGAKITNLESQVESATTRLNDALQLHANHARLKPKRRF